MVTLLGHLKRWGGRRRPSPYVIFWHPRGRLRRCHYYPRVVLSGVRPPSVLSARSVFSGFVPSIVLRRERDRCRFSRPGPYMMSEEVTSRERASGAAWRLGPGPLKVSQTEEHSGRGFGWGVSSKLASQLGPRCSGGKSRSLVLSDACPTSSLFASLSQESCSSLAEVPTTQALRDESGELVVESLPVVKSPSTTALLESFVL
ncbi:hypothetical protein MRX96_033494 [Rhipicephalus microplus]